MTAGFVKLQITYDGTNYSGWQVQPSRPTIQNEIQKALTKVLNETVAIVGAGRTDAGVHAMGQVASFARTSNLPAAAYCPGLNSYLPNDIRIIDASLEDDFHALRSAQSKEYHYYFSLGAYLHPLASRFCWRPRSAHKINVDVMQEAAKSFTGEHDFTSFCAADSDVQTMVRTITHLSINPVQASDLGILSDSMFCLRICANGFLKQMVRNIVGTLVEIGEGKRNADEIASILNRKDRQAAGPTAPAQGLILYKVTY